MSASFSDHTLASRRFLTILDISLVRRNLTSRTVFRADFRSTVTSTRVHRRLDVKSPRTAQANRYFTLCFRGGLAFCLGTFLPKVSNHLKFPVITYLRISPRAPAKASLLPTATYQFFLSSGELLRGLKFIDSSLGPGFAYSFPEFFELLPCASRCPAYVCMSAAG
jgi:hypothetical protein